MICLICMPSAHGPAALGLWVFISGKSLVPMLQLLHVSLCGWIKEKSRDTVVSPKRGIQLKCISGKLRT